MPPARYSVAMNFNKLRQLTTINDEHVHKVPQTPLKIGVNPEGREN